MSIDEERVEKLSEAEVNEIIQHYDSAMETDRGSGDHWILMSVLDKYGFRTFSPTKAMELAGEIITIWFRSR